MTKVCVNDDAFGDEFIEGESGLIALAIAQPADAGRQTLEMNLLPGQGNPMDVLLVDLDCQADAFVHRNGQWLRSACQMPLNEVVRYPS